MSVAKGERVNGFTLTRIREISEYESTGRYFVHDRTGCPVYHLVNDDEENLFSFIFKTPPSDSKGTAHIIEHSVLSGSKVYPIKDPFVALMRGSMNTFLNAMTYPDKTMYPASSTVKQDFFNLLEVYGDSVFFPLLRKESFHQEGRRLVIGDSGDLEVDGVVYNEMKGSYSSHDSIVGEWSYRSLFPDTSYRFDSGGEPKEIRDLTYQEFLDFHKRWYHPSNCRIFLYGNIPSEEILPVLDERFLSKFSRESVDASIAMQPRWGEPVSISLTSPTGAGAGEGAGQGGGESSGPGNGERGGEREDQDPDSGTSITINWLTAPIQDPLVVLSLEILTEILLGHSGSPLQKAIVESGLGEDLSPVSGLDTQTLELVFSVGLRGTAPDKRKAFEDLVLSTFSDLVESGIPVDLISGALRRVEFRNREIKGGAPFGLRLLSKATRGWLHDEDPELTLEFEPWMKKVVEHAGRKGYFEGLIRSLLLENPHRSTVIVTPDEGHGKRENEEFESWKKSKLAETDENEKKRLRAEIDRLERFQEEPDDPEDVARIPSLDISDLPKSVDTIAIAESKEEMPVHLLEQYTNGIVYAEFAIDVEQIPESVSISLPLFCRAACHAGLPGTPYDEVANLLSIHTGGFTSFLETNTVLPSQTGQAASQRSLVFFRLKALEGELEAALDLAFKLMLDADFSDSARVKDLLFELRNDFKAQLIPAGHSFASLRAGSRLSAVVAAEERWKGITQFFHLNGIANPESIESVCGALVEARKEIMTRARVTTIVTADAGASSEAVRLVKAALARLPEGRTIDKTTPITDPAVESASFESLIIPATVGYMAEIIRASKYGEIGHAPELVVAQLLRTGYLWEQIRMRGGAYGAFAGADGGEGLFSFSSYRDPNVLSTFEAFHQGFDHIVKHVSDEEVEKAIISVVGREVRPLSPSEKSMIAFRRNLYGINDEMRQEKRNSLLAVTTQQVRDAANRLVAGFAVSSSSALAGSEAIDEASLTRPEIGKIRTNVPL